MTGWTVDEIAARAARDIPEGAIVNLGIGQPERVADHLPPELEIILHSENGILGMGPQPPKADEDMELINAGKKPVTLLAGGAFFHHADSFAMIRGGHVDICLLGAFEVAANGDLANWSTGADGVPAVGGAMDLAAGAGSVRVITSHTTRNGAPKLLEALTLPATGRRIVKRIYTDLAVLEPRGEGFELIECAPGIDVSAVRAATGATVFERPGNFNTMPTPERKEH
ncbi:3-oxoacid CoA-transferase subunit B [Sphingomonas sp. AR_OL41]|uniref:3-oxoacid CoA-transferase subunit B n=1 Tax=Sphingomonas sp. AR_OL41 TaxID=3042729 RepID=UPI002480AE4C|nr:3-oxoacid CoA-transferase subunit B [Sphingomonas sp. AR_OL41]MDH7972119.1 3-oxoacid CoA-transferase subunit B [Sphingomonas sp. AR_OL41]